MVARLKSEISGGRSCAHCSRSIDRNWSTRIQRSSVAIPNLFTNSCRSCGENPRPVGNSYCNGNSSHASRPCHLAASSYRPASRKSQAGRTCLLGTPSRPTSKPTTRGPARRVLSTPMTGNARFTLGFCMIPCAGFTRLFEANDQARRNISHTSYAPCTACAPCSPSRPNCRCSANLSLPVYSKILKGPGLTSLDRLCDADSAFSLARY